MTHKAEWFLKNKIGVDSGLFRHSKAAMVIAREEFGIDDEEILVATLLHDVLEDTDVEEAELKTLFGQRVAEIVQKMRSDLKRVRYIKSLLPAKQAFLESCDDSEAKRLYAELLADYESEVRL